jgi:hypothetical protein
MVEAAGGGCEVQEVGDTMSFILLVAAAAY